MDNLNLNDWNDFLIDVDFEEYYSLNDAGSASDDRAREWTFLVYPEFAKPNWKQLLDNLHIQWVCSPLHHGYLDSGVERKDHYHVIVVFKGKKSLDQIQRLSNLTHLFDKGVKPLRVNSERGLLRYFLHLDNPEKEQFDSDVHVDPHGGIKLDPTIFEPVSIDMDVCLFQMREFIEKNNIVEWHLLYDYAAKYKRSSWFYYLNHSCANVMKLYLNSKRHSKRDIKGRSVDPYTGVIIDIDDFIE